MNALSSRHHDPDQRRESLVQQIPKRAGALRRRGEQLCQNDWDINAALVLAEDAEALASTCRVLQSTHVAARLENVAECLWDLLDPPVIPDEDARRDIRDLLLALFEDGDAAAVAHADTGSWTSLQAQVAEADNGYPLLTRPPAEYWKKFADPGQPVAQVRLESTAPARQEAPTPPPAPIEAPPPPSTPEPSVETASRALHSVTEDAAAEAPAAEVADVHNLACHLGDHTALSSDIDLQLRAEGYVLDRVRGVDGLKVTLSRLAPALIVLGSAHSAVIEEIGALVQSARARSKQRIIFIALSAQSIDLAARLRAMRSGCDVFMVEPERADEVLARVRELKVAEDADPYRIMIVEDDRSQALFAESILRKNGMQAIAVGEASLVLDKLDEFHPDLILMDLNMPVCDGMELTALIREREAYISTPIVFLSGEGDTEKHFAALSIGGDDFLTKPIAPRHLIAAVKSRVKRARMVDSRRRQKPAREAVKGLHDSAQLSRRLAEMLAMEDAATRVGGLVHLELADARELSRQLSGRAMHGLLESLTRHLASRIGGNDMLARCGEHGFLLLNPDRATPALETLVNDLRESIAAESFGDAAAPVHVDVLAGICPFNIAAGDAKAMIDSAEEALLAARAPGSRGVVVSTRDEGTGGSAHIADVIRHALNQSSFRVLFQPIISLQGDTEEQFQALLRLPAEDERIYAASEVIPVAEEVGLIAEVDRWMIQSCLNTIAEHLREGRNLRLFVSQSSSSVCAHDAIEWMRGALDSLRIPANQISIELRMGDASAALSPFVGYCLGMKQLGVSLTLSGFEAGEQGSELLRHLPVDYVKLSSRYTRTNDDAIRMELRRLVELAHANERLVIAPRVEEARIAAALWSSGIDLIQGNFVREAARDTTFDFQMGSA